MSACRIFHKIYVLDDPPDVPNGILYVAVFFRKMGFVLCLTGLYKGIGAGKVILESINELTRDPEDLPRLKYEYISWDDVEMIVVLGECFVPPVVRTPVLNPLPGRPPVPNDVPVFHVGVPIPAVFRRKVQHPDMRYKPYHPRFQMSTPFPGSNSFLRPDTRVRPFWETCLRGKPPGRLQSMDPFNNRQ